MWISIFTSVLFYFFSCYIWENEYSFFLLFCNRVGIAFHWFSYSAKFCKARVAMLTGLTISFEFLNTSLLQLVCCISKNKYCFKTWLGKSVVKQCCKQKSHTLSNEYFNAAYYCLLAVHNYLKNLILIVQQQIAIKWLRNC